MKHETMWVIYFQNEDDISRESSPCKSPDTGTKEKGTELDPKEPATEAFTKPDEEIGMDKHW
jgi:hypothetical protein